jgi:hypothetical protein
LRRAKPRIPRVERRLLPLACASCLAPEAAFVELLKAPASTIGASRFFLVMAAPRVCERGGKAVSRQWRP